MDISPINSKKNYQSIVEQFVQLIKNGKLKMGEKLPPERTLAEMFNVSRSSIREAFSAMEIIGLIEVRPGEGSFISDLNIAPFINTIAPLFVKDDNMEKELVEFRKMLELEAVTLAAGKITTKKADLLIGPIYMMKESVDKDDTDLGVKADIRFHTTLFNLTDNFILKKAAECVASILEHSVKFNRKRILKDAANSIKLYNQHMDIYEAIKKGDVKQARSAMEEHLGFVSRYLDEY